MMRLARGIGLAAMALVSLTLAWWAPSQVPSHLLPWFVGSVFMAVAAVAFLSATALWVFRERAGMNVVEVGTSEEERFREWIEPRPLSFDELRKLNVARCEAVFHPLDSWSAAEWAMALTGELGEACNLLKKARRGEAVPTEAIADELADVMIYLDLLAARLGINLAESVVRKFNIVSDRRNCRDRFCL
jgi:NTP pyrophosphatase (non-canonical NTP hydrolase)